MEKDRQVKVLSIIALLVAVVGMSLGFAAFSVTLNISSSATVKPSSDNFKLQIYGFGTLQDFMAFTEKWENGVTEDDMKVLSDSVSIPVINENSNIALIDNNSLTISNMNSFFDDYSFGNMQEEAYYFIIKNVGEYDAYIDENLLESINNKISCYAVGDTNEILVEQSCHNFEILYGFFDSKVEYYEENLLDLVIPKNGAVMFFMCISYDTAEGDVLPDGPFKVEIDSFTIPFTSNSSY